MTYILLVALIGCGPPPSDFSCTCNNSFSFASDTETENYNEIFYCYEDEEAGTWVDEEIQLCEEYASDADSHTCECSCNDDSKCN
jgi:hypothetical protein